MSTVTAHYPDPADKRSSSHSPHLYHDASCVDTTHSCPHALRPLLTWFWGLSITKRTVSPGDIRETSLTNSLVSPFLASLQARQGACMLCEPSPCKRQTKVNAEKLGIAHQWSRVPCCIQCMMELHISNFKRFTQTPHLVTLLRRLVAVY